MMRGGPPVVQSWAVPAGKLIVSVSPDIVRVVLPCGSISVHIGSSWQALKSSERMLPNSLVVKASSLVEPILPCSSVARMRK